MSERPEPNIDRVREALRRHDERPDSGPSEEEENGEPAPAERPEDEEDAES